MSQLNIHMNASFEKDLHKFMKLRSIPTKSAAIRIAIREGIQYATANTKVEDFSQWLGLGVRVPTNKKHKFFSDKDLWE